MATSFLQDAAQAIKNIGGEEGVELEVSIDNQSLMKLGVMMSVIVLGGVALNHLLKNI